MAKIGVYLIHNLKYMMYNNMAWNSHYGMGFNGAGGLIGFPGFGGFLALALIWTIAIKGYALWHAARRNEPWWFFFLLVINTFGILELIYLIFVAKVLFSKGDDTHHHHHTNG